MARKNTVHHLFMDTPCVFGGPLITESQVGLGPKGVADPCFKGCRMTCPSVISIDFNLIILQLFGNFSHKSFWLFFYLLESRFFDDSQDPYISLPSPPSPIPRTRENMLRRLAANKSVRASRGEGPQVLMKYFEIRQPMDNGKAFGAEVAPTLGHGAWAKSRYKPTMLRPDWR